MVGMRNRNRDEIGWDIEGNCKDCANRRICVLFDGVYRTKVITLGGEYQAEVLKCKWYVDERGEE